MCGPVVGHDAQQEAADWIYAQERHHPQAGHASLHIGARVLYEAAVRARAEYQERGTEQERENTRQPVRPRERKPMET